MESPTYFGTAALLAGSLLLVAAIACAETRVPSTPIPPATPLPAPTAPPAPTPTDEQRRIQTPMNFGSNTRIVDGDIHVWHIPTCPPVPPATWVAPVILTDLRSGSNLHLNRDGSIRDSPAPDYRSDEGRERIAEVLGDSSLMEFHSRADGMPLTTGYFEVDCDNEISRPQCGSLAMGNPTRCSCQTGPRGGPRQSYVVRT